MSDYAQKIIEQAEKVRETAKRATKPGGDIERMGRYAMYRFLNRTFNTSRFVDGVDYVSLVESLAA